MRRGVVSILFVLTCFLAGCSDDGSAADLGPTAADLDPTGSVITSTLGPIEREVEAAYLRSWEVYRRALRTLEVAGVEATHTGQALQTVTAEVAKLRAAGTPVDGTVDHRYEIEMTGTDSAIVVDEYVNHLVLLDAGGNPTESDPNERVHYRFTLIKLEGTWRVERIG